VPPRCRDGTDPEASGASATTPGTGCSCGRLIPDAWEAKQSWYQPPGTATFLVLGLTSPAGAHIAAAGAAAQFGPPQRVARIGGTEVLVWHHDLLPAVTGGYAPGCGPTWHR
jgi:hypothetical protein